MAKYTGRNMVVKFGTVNVAGQGRNLDISQSANELDVTSYGSTAQEFIAGLTERSATLEILDDDTASLIRTSTQAGSVGSLTWFPQGTTAGLPKFSVGTAVITEQNLQYPYDDVVLMNVSMRLSGAVTEGTAP